MKIVFLINRVTQCGKVPKDFEDVSSELRYVTCRFLLLPSLPSFPSFFFYFVGIKENNSRFQGWRSLSLGSMSACLLGLWVRIPHGRGGMPRWSDVCC
jgi:hypothetical protein